MTITATIHVNGNYECPIVYEQGEARTEMLISGKGKPGGETAYIHYSHGPDPMVITVGPEKYIPDESQAA